MTLDRARVHLRGVAGGSLLAAACWLSRRLPGAPDTSRLLTTRVFAGPLRGAYLAMPRLERPSFALGTYERHVVRAMRTLVRPGDVVYDVGAHVGYISLVLSRLVRRQGLVVAFEPDIANGVLLEWNLRQNSTSNYRIVHAAVAATPGQVSFASFSKYSAVGHILRPETPGDADVVTVQAVSLDSVAFGTGEPPPSFVKIDIEGGELEALTGASRLLAEYRPAVLVEVRSGDLWRDVAAFMRGSGYTVEVLKGEPALEAQGYGEVLCRPVPNFHTG